MRLESWFFDAIFWSSALFIIYQGRRVLGRERLSIFLWGSILWTASIENAAIMCGLYDYYGYSNYYSFAGRVIEGYDGWVSTVLFVPLSVCMAWFLISLPALIFSNRILGQKSSIWLKAAFAAVILVCFDLVLDPIAVVNEWWRWTGPGLYVLGVPVPNFFGWFFLLFFFGAVYERTVLQLKGFRWTSGIEKLIFRTDTSDLSDMEWFRVSKIFYVRLILFFPLFYICSTAVSIPLNLLFPDHWGPFSVNWGPFDSVFPNLPLPESLNQQP